MGTAPSSPHHRLRKDSILQEVGPAPYGELTDDQAQSPKAKVRVASPKRLLRRWSSALKQEQHNAPHCENESISACMHQREEDLSFLVDELVCALGEACLRGSTLDTLLGLYRDWDLPPIHRPTASLKAAVSESGRLSSTGRLDIPGRLSSMSADVVGCIAEEARLHIHLLHHVLKARAPLEPSPDLAALDRLVSPTPRMTDHLLTHSSKSHLRSPHQLPTALAALTTELALLHAAPQYTDAATTIASNSSSSTAPGGEKMNAQLDGHHVLLLSALHVSVSPKARAALLDLGRALNALKMAALPVCDVMSEPLLRNGSLLRIGTKGACRKVEAWLFPSRLLLTGTSALRKTLVLDQQVLLGGGAYWRLGFDGEGPTVALAGRGELLTLRAADNKEGKAWREALLQVREWWEHGDRCLEKRTELEEKAARRAVDVALGEGIVDWKAVGPPSQAAAFA